MPQGDDSRSCGPEARAFHRVPNSASPSCSCEHGRLHCEHGRLRSSPTTAHLHWQPPLRLPNIDPLRHRSAGSTAATVTIAAGVVGVSPVTCNYFLEDSELLVRAATAAAGRCSAAWSCKAAAKAAQAAQQRCSCLRAAQVGRPRVSGGPGGVTRLADSRRRRGQLSASCLKKVPRVGASLSGLRARVWRAPVWLESANSPLSNGIWVVGGLVKSCWGS
jgi:hypothetical protein